jgi:hypothetical protein
MTRNPPRASGRVVILAALALAASLTGQARAHGLAERYNPPIPLWLYVWGAGVVVILSFALLSVFSRRPRDVRTYPRINLLRWPPGRALAHPAILLSLRSLSVAIFFVVVAAGLVGQQSPFKNIAPVMVWVIGWVGLSLASALLGDLWALVNPWKILFAWAERVYTMLRPGRMLEALARWPDRLGVWPAAALFLVFAWLELVWTGRDRPRSLALALLLYSAITWGGMLVFGRNTWLRSGEAFSVVFRLLARFAPSEVRVTDRAVCRSCDSEACGEQADDCINCYACYARASPTAREWNVRPPAIGLLSARPVRVSTLVMVLLMLCTVTFDGFIETPAWADILKLLVGVPATQPALGAPASAVPSSRIVLSLALIASPLFFLGVYALFAWLMVWAIGARSAASPARPATGHEPVTASRLARRFILTLLPIAIAYHVAHYLSFFLLAGQLVIPLASDPFGLGWDLLGTALNRIDVGIVGAGFIWYTAVIAVVTGHVLGVYLAHATATQVFGNGSPAARGQYPMLLLMVGYTMISLWILAQPIVETGAR